MERSGGEVVVDGVRQHEVAVGEALHERGRAEPVGAVVGEVGLPHDEQAGDRGLQVVVDPQPAHRVVHRRVDAHRGHVRVVAGDPLVHLEEVAVLGLDGVAAEPGDRVGEVEVDAEAAGADAAALVADVLRGAGGDVARHEVAERRVDPLEVVVAFVLGDVGGTRSSPALDRHPHPAVVAQRLAHQRELALVGRRTPGCRSGGSACSTGWRTGRPCGGPARSR